MTLSGGLAQYKALGASKGEREPQKANSERVVPFAVYCLLFSLLPDSSRLFRPGGTNGSATVPLPVELPQDLELSQDDRLLDARRCR